MKSKITFLGLCLMLFASSSIYAQYTTLDFESTLGGTGLTWTEDANGGAAAPYSNFIANPVSGGINTSTNVASYSRCIRAWIFTY
jgi:hypothetical protein